MSDTNPVHSNDRVWLMDSLRGFAILGIFIANLSSGFSFYNPTEPHSGALFHRFDNSLLFWQHLFIEGKFYSIFSLLFGWGIALQLQRLESKVAKPASLLRRRLFIMLLLGLAHLILIWIGDIVALYAMVGFILIAIRNWKTKTLFILAISLILSPILLYYLKMTWPVLNAPAGILFQTGGRIDELLSGTKGGKGFKEVVQHGTYIEQVKLHIAGFFFRYGDLFFQSRIVKVLGVFILGFLLGRNKRYLYFLERKQLLVWIAVLGFTIGFPANYLLAGYMENSDAYYDLKIEGWYQTIAYAFGVVPFALAYTATFFLLSRTKRGAAVLSVLRPVGKMAFTNYITHSVIGTILFTGVGFGMMGQVGPVICLLLALIVFALQIILSTVWLAYFEFGPIEWLWRSATYGKRQAVKRKVVAM